ncbi:MAG: SpoIIE family protein phosphatase [Eubacteriales bacterium]|nr:SpoIIE family protein phosphatase [Eubacteriales bacterium]MDD4390380.1 SpoIIE family protein phosphatase [Eubacteriales bacterium]
MKKTNLCADIGCTSLTKAGEQACGDHFQIVEQQGENSLVIVMADGLGSGIKASILSTLTARILSTMAAEGLSLEECVNAISAALPICSVRGVAYSTFTIIYFINYELAQIVQYDSPRIILLRDGKNHEIPYTEHYLSGKKILRSNIYLKKNDIFIAMSDGVEHAGRGNIYNFSWKRDDIIKFMETFPSVGFSAKTLTTLLIKEVDKLYGGEPADDATVCTVHIRERVPMNLVFGPPADHNDDQKIMSLFFAKEGKHIVSGGITSKIAARYLGKPIKINAKIEDPEIPPTSTIEGVDLVTEGIITLSRVLQYAKNTIDDNKDFEKWGYGFDGASQISRLLFEEATDINFFIGQAVNPAHQKPGLTYNFNIKKRLVEELSECLKKMGKRIKVIYF